MLSAAAKPRRTTGRLRADLVDAAPPREGASPGPWATAIGMAFVFIAPIFVLGAYSTRPTLVTAMSLGAIGSVLLLPKDVLLSMRISLALVGYVCWAVASIGWALSTQGTYLLVRQLIPAVVAMAVVAAYLPRETFLLTLRRSFQFIVLLTMFAVVATPSGRSVGMLENGVDLAGGWRGFFDHKNLMSPVIVLGTVINLSYEKDWRVRHLVTGCAVVLMIGSQSVTGLVALIVGIVAWLWSGVLARADLRSRSIVRVSTALIGIVLLGLTLNLVGSLLEAFGKDVTFSSRTIIWELTWPLIERRPLHGYGLLGPLADLRTQEGIQVFGELKFYVAHAHNALVDLLATLGVVGLVFVVAVVFSCFRAAWRAIDRSPDTARWVIASLVVLIFMGFSENTFNAGYMMIVAAMRVSLLVEAGLHSTRLSHREVSAPLALDVSA